MNKYDLVIIGSGPAGYTAGIYAARYKLKTLIIGEIKGGTAAEAYKVCNFPTYESINGFKLMKLFQDHVKGLGVETKQDTVNEIVKENEHFKIVTPGEEIFAKKVILATGTKKRKLDIKNEKKFLGRGVSYCATCDGAFFKDKKVVVVGGGDAALTAALLVSEFATNVTLVHRGSEFDKAEPTWVEQVKKNPNIEVIYNANAIELEGDQLLEKVKLDNGQEIETNGFFIEIGAIPKNNLAKNVGVELTDRGYMKVDKERKTNIAGLFAAGDITNNSLKQIVTAAADGAIAANSAYKEIARSD